MEAPHSEDFVIPRKVKDSGFLDIEDMKVRSFEYGNKRLEVVILPGIARATATIFNVNGEKIPGSTTCLFGLAKDAMVSLAQQIGPITFNMVTGDEKMKAWNESKGKEMFNWDRIESEGNIQEVTVKIKPPNITKS